MELRKFIEMANPIIAEEWVEGRSFDAVFMELHDVSSYEIEGKSYCIELWVHDNTAGFSVTYGDEPEIVFNFERTEPEVLAYEETEQNKLIIDILCDITLRSVSPHDKYKLIEPDTVEKCKNEREKL